MKLLIALFCAQLLQAAPVNIVDVLYRPSGNPPQVAAGTDITITQSAFTNPAGNYYPAFQLTPHPVSDAGGNINIWLEPNVAGQPYKILYRATNGVLTNEYWTVPVSATPLKIKDVRTTVGPTPPTGIVQLGQLAQGGALDTNVITWDNTLKTWKAAAAAGGVSSTQVQQNSLVCANDTGPDGTEYDVSLSPLPTIVQYTQLCFKAAHTNINGVTLCVNSPSGFQCNSIENSSEFVIASGEILAGSTVVVQWTTAFGGIWQMLSPSSATAVNAGGTGANTFTAHGTLIGEGNNPFAAGSPGTAGQCWMSNGSIADPSMQTCPGAGGGALNFQSFPVASFYNGSLNASMFMSGTGTAILVTAANGPLSTAYSVPTLLITAGNYITFPTSYEASSGTVDIGWKTINREGVSGGGQWNFSVYIGCAASGANMTYGTASTLTATPTSTAGVFSSYQVTAVNLAAGCAAHKPMQVWLFRTADTGGVTGLNTAMVSVDVTQH